MNLFRKYKNWLSTIAVLLVVVATAYLVRDRWWPQVSKLFAGNSAAAKDKHDDHAPHGDGNSLTLSEQALKNIGYREETVKLQPFVKSTTIPAMVVERPGRSQIDVTAPMTGVVTKVYVVEGEAVAPDQKLFELRLTHEDLVTAQRDFLRSAEELDVVRRELDRLKAIGEGVIAGKRVLEIEYEKQKLEAALHAQHEGLLLHGLVEEQVAAILKDRSLLKSLTIVAPQGTNDCVALDAQQGAEHLFSIQKLNVKPGQQVTAGTSLCMLSDHCRLYIEGKAFEEDAIVLNEAALRNKKVSAVRISRDSDLAAENDLEILYLADRVEADSRALHFYISLPNQLIRNQKKEGHRFIGWKYKPGQRFEVRVPINRGEDDEESIVLPVDAIVEEGAETFVFQRNGDHFDRVAVHVKDRDRDRVAIDNDGQLYPGEIIATKGAHEMYLTIKKQSAGPVDPHAGHNH